MCSSSETYQCQSRVPRRFTLYELGGVVTNLLAGIAGSRWGIRATLLTGLTLQLAGIGMLYGWRTDCSKEEGIIYVTFAQLLAGVAKGLTKLGGKTVAQLVTPDEKQSYLFKLVSFITGALRSCLLIHGAGDGMVEQKSFCCKRSRVLIAACCKRSRVLIATNQLVAIRPRCSSTCVTTQRRSNAYRWHAYRWHAYRRHAYRWHHELCMSDCLAHTTKMRPGTRKLWQQQLRLQRCA
jgi:hypothetical protein